MKLKIVTPPPKPVAPAYDPSYDIGRIVSLLCSQAPEHQAAIAKLRRDCPEKHSTTFRGIPVEPAYPQTVAMWAAKQPDLVKRLKARSLI